MYTDNHSKDWSRRRPDFSREEPRERYIRREAYYTPHYSPKRRKLDSGEPEPVEFEPQRRKPYLTSYDSGRPTPPRAYYPHDYERHLHEGSHYYPREYGRPHDYNPGVRRHPPDMMYPDYSMGPEVDRKNDYQRRMFEEPMEDRIIGRKRSRDDPSSPRFLRREFDVRGAYHGFRLPPSESYHQDGPSQSYYKPQVDEWQRSSIENSKDQQTSPTDKCDDDDGSDDEKNISKVDIIKKMDLLDTEINQVEEEIQKFKRLKSQCQLTTDKSNLSAVDKVLLTNQEIANSNFSQMKLFQKVEVVSKTRANFIHIPDNASQHKLLRPRMMQYMRRTKLKAKQRTKILVEEYDSKLKRWGKLLIKDIPNDSSNTINNNNTLPPTNIPPSTIQIQPTNQPTSGRRRNRNFDAVRSEAEFTQVIQQLNDKERQDPNLRYMKTIAIIPPMLMDDRDKSRVFLDNNRFVEDCKTEYKNHLLTNPWNTDEQDIFLRKYLLYPKQFGKIASFLRNKSITDVICYYFKNKHRLNLKGIIHDMNTKKRTQRVSRQLPRKPQQTNSTTVSQIKESGPSSDFSNSDSAYWALSATRGRERITRSQVRPTTTTTTSDSNRRNSSKSTSKPRGKSPSSSRKTGPGKKLSAAIKSGEIDQTCFPANLPTPWNDIEISQFKMALIANGTDFKAIAEFIGTKNHWQCRSFYYNFYKHLKLTTDNNNNSNNSSSISTPTMDSKFVTRLSDPLRSSNSSFDNTPILESQFSPKTLHLPLQPLQVERKQFEKPTFDDTIIVEENSKEESSFEIVKDSSSSNSHVEHKEIESNNIPEENIVPQNWVLEAPTENVSPPPPTVPKTFSQLNNSGNIASSFASFGNSSTSKPLVYQKPFDSISDKFPNVLSKSPSGSLRRSFDTFSPLEHNETKSVNWQVDSSVPLHHSVDFSLGPSSSFTSNTIKPNPTKLNHSKSSPIYSSTEFETEEQTGKVIITKPSIESNNNNSSTTSTIQNENSQQPTNNKDVENKKIDDEDIVMEEETTVITATEESIKDDDCQMMEQSKDEEDKTSIEESKDEDESMVDTIDASLVKDKTSIEEFKDEDKSMIDSINESSVEDKSIELVSVIDESKNQLEKSIETKDSSTENIIDVKEDDKLLKQNIIEESLEETKVEEEGGEGENTTVIETIPVENTEILTKSVDEVVEEKVEITESLKIIVDEKESEKGMPNIENNEDKICKIVHVPKDNMDNLIDSSNELNIIKEVKVDESVKEDIINPIAELKEEIEVPKIENIQEKEIIETKDIVMEESKGETDITQVIEEKTSEILTETTTNILDKDNT